VISREEIQKKLWPSGTFVDFDHSVNTIINKIREALSDSASSPHFVETLAKRGYRFMVPVRSSSIAAVAEAGEISDERKIETSESIDARQESSLLTNSEELPVISHTYVRALFLLIQVMYLIFYVIALARLPAVEDVIERVFGAHPTGSIVAIISASIGIPLRLYLISAASFDVKDLSRRFLMIFPGVLVVDELWALAPFLLVGQIGVGLALGVTAALVYLPFAQRTLVLMRERASKIVALQK
jgi:cholera toxin transcriptional activator